VQPSALARCPGFEGEEEWEDGEEEEEEEEDLDIEGALGLGRER
jgi:hypothetical protein